jgi:hypothetical protein
MKRARETADGVRVVAAARWLEEIDLLGAGC